MYWVAYKEGFSMACPTNANDKQLGKGTGKSFGEINA